jgi:hypothetical protein
MSFSMADTDLVWVASYNGAQRTPLCPRTRCDRLAAAKC